MRLEGWPQSRDLEPSFQTRAPERALHATAAKPLRVDEGRSLQALRIRYLESVVEIVTAVQMPRHAGARRWSAPPSPAFRADAQPCPRRRRWFAVLPRPAG